MKIKNIKYVALAAVFGMGATSCDDFLDRPTEDNYNQSNFTRMIPSVCRE